MIENGREAAQNGNVQAVVFKFSETGDVPLGAFVVPATSFFKGFGPSSLPKAPAQTPSASPSGTPGAPSGTPSGECLLPRAARRTRRRRQRERGHPTDAASASVSADTPTD